MRSLSFEVPQAGNGEGGDDEDSSINGVVEKPPSGVLCRFFCSGDADLLDGCCLLCDEVSEVLSDDEQMGLFSVVSSSRDQTDFSIPGHDPLPASQQSFLLRPSAPWRDKPYSGYPIGCGRW